MSLNGKGEPSAQPPPASGCRRSTEGLLLAEGLIMKKHSARVAPLSACNSPVLTLTKVEGKRAQPARIRAGLLLFFSPGQKKVPLRLGRAAKTLPPGSGPPWGRKQARRALGMGRLGCTCLGSPGRAWYKRERLPRGSRRRRMGFWVACCSSPLPPLLLLLRRSWRGGN